MTHDLEINKNNAIDFYRLAYLGQPEKAVELYVGDEYIQHNPLMGDGIKAFIHYFKTMHRRHPNKRVEFVRTIAQGDLVALHTHQTWPKDQQYITMDFLRFNDKGKIVEHWDSIQSVPKSAKNGNTMY